MTAAVGVEGVAGCIFGHIDFHFAWRIRMALGWLWWCAWFSGIAVGAVAFRVASIALGDI